MNDQAEQEHTHFFIYYADVDLSACTVCGVIRIISPKVQALQSAEVKNDHDHSYEYFPEHGCHACIICGVIEANCTYCEAQTGIPMKVGEYYYCSDEHKTIMENKIAKALEKFQERINRKDNKHECPGRTRRSQVRKHRTIN